MAGGHGMMTLLTLVVTSVIKLCWQGGPVCPGTKDERVTPLMVFVIRSSDPCNTASMAIAVGVTLELIACGPAF